MEDNLRERVEAIREITNIFLFERIVYLVSCIGVLIVLFVALFSIFSNGQVGRAELGLLGGSSGLLVTIMGFSLRMWNKAMKTVFEIPKNKG